MKTIITALVALVIGAGGMYFYQQGSMKQLQTAAVALETQLSEAKTAAEAATGEVAKLQEAGKSIAAELAEAKSKAESSAAELANVQAKVTDLEAALAAAKAGSGTTQ